MSVFVQLVTTKFFHLPQSERSMATKPKQKTIDLTKPPKEMIDLTKPPPDLIDLTQPRQRAHPFISYRTGNNPGMTSNTEISNLDMDYEFLSQQSENDNKDNDIDNNKQISPSKESHSKKKTQKGK